jgi:zinc D-Ala-D-Ala dipeptidase
MRMRRAAIAGLTVCLAAAAVSIAQDVPATAPPRETGPFRAPDLVELVVLDPTIHLDIRYATPNNLAGRPVYTEARAFLQRPAAEALVQVSRRLRERGYGLLVFDGYRPWAVTRLFWDVTPPEKRQFVADPRRGSRHNRGCAVDLSLYELRTGVEVPMPSMYDEMSPRASATYEGGSPDARAHREMLRTAMEAEGFTVEPDEWWHFNYPVSPPYRILDIPFGEIGKGR